MRVGPTAASARFPSPSTVSVPTTLARRPAAGGGIGARWWRECAAGGHRERVARAAGARATEQEYAGMDPDGARVLFLAESAEGREVVARSWNRSAPDQVLLRDRPTDSGKSRLVHPGVRLSCGWCVGHDNALFVAPYDSLAAYRPLVATAANETTATISADGRLLAYASNESGILEVYVQPLTGPGGRVLVSVGGGTEPIWSNDGHILFYRGPTSVMRAELGDAPRRVLRRRILFLRQLHSRSAREPPELGCLSRRPGVPDDRSPVAGLAASCLSW